MPNYCEYEMKIKGSKSAIKRVMDCLKADYNYGVGKPAHKHFFRVFSAEPTNDKPILNEDGTYTQHIFGDCAWSVYSCMVGEFGGCYYGEVKKEHPDIFMGTTLKEQSKNCEIEVFSEEPGVGFSEHYYFKNGETLINETTELTSAGYDKKGKLTTRINWDTYEGEYVYLNSFRAGINEGYIWEL